MGGKGLVIVTGGSRGIEANIPIKRVGTAAEVAEAVAWLLNSVASYVSGAITAVSGGR